ncbi:hypothetical protein CANMA_000821 [Candida margitis]|uniref:uncharacterized protein n=1 Tax=Candida margitis TaxID=1775924 RepID=UPI0022265C7F|nr:uncharacterized protein CANMA_000821 [Candida margitis]KAI5970209.1 hypothetical protein CANMA_000821 [Candida margitis]
MIIPTEDAYAELSKRVYYSPYYNNDSNWYRYRWLLWLLILIPILVFMIMFCVRRRRSTANVYYPQQQNQQYYESHPSQSYVPPENPQTYQTGGYNNYGNQGYAGTYEPSGSQQGYGGYGPSGGQQQQPYYSREQEFDVAGEDYSRPAGPPPAHTKA